MIDTDPEPISHGFVNVDPDTDTDPDPLTRDPDHDTPSTTNDPTTSTLPDTVIEPPPDNDIAPEAETADELKDTVPLPVNASHPATV